MIGHNISSRSLGRCLRTIFSVHTPSVSKGLTSLGRCILSTYLDRNPTEDRTHHIVSITILAPSRRGLCGPGARKPQTVFVSGITGNRPRVGRQMPCVVSGVRDDREGTGHRSADGGRRSDLGRGTVSGASTGRFPRRRHSRYRSRSGSRTRRARKAEAGRGHQPRTVHPSEASPQTDES